MNPEQIEAVVADWSLATTDAEVLGRVLADGLPGSDEQRSSRAAWIVGAVSCLSQVLDHPTKFAPLVANLVARRSPVSVDDLAVDRDALLGALRTLLGPLGEEAEQAWSLAFGLFAEIVAGLGLDPFGGLAPTMAVAGPERVTTGGINECH